MTTQTRDKDGAAVSGQDAGTPPFLSSARRVWSLCRAAWPGGEWSSERRHAVCAAGALSEFADFVRRGRPPRWARWAALAERPLPSAAASPAVRRRRFVLRACARDVLFHLADASRDLPLADFRPDPPFLRRVESLVAAARHLERAAAPGATTAERRRSLEDLRRSAREVREGYEEGLATRHRADGAVRFLERRELERQLWRVAEALARCARPIDESLP
jgi:hypothetical protein